MARFYPLVQQARSLVHEGSLGEIWNVHGSYLQDWLLRPTDWNWRLEPERGGELRAIGDIGSHWLDLVQFVTGSRIVEVFADLQTVIPIRRRPVGPVQTFAPTEAEGEDVAIATEDLAHVLLRFEGGTRGAVVTSQVSAGRKNMLSFELDGDDAALAWNSERAEELWLGRRDQPNEVLLRDPSLMKPAARETRRRCPAATRKDSRRRFGSSTGGCTGPWRAAVRPRSRTTQRSLTVTGRTRDARDRVLARCRRRAPALFGRHSIDVDSFDPDAAHELLGGNGGDLGARVLLE